MFVSAIRVEYKVKFPAKCDLRSREIGNSQLIRYFLVSFDEDTFSWQKAGIRAFHRKQVTFLRERLTSRYTCVNLSKGQLTLGHKTMQIFGELTREPV